MQIWKFPIPVTDYFTTTMPKGAKFLALQVQRSEPCAWFLVNPDNEPEGRRFFVVGTGHNVPAEAGEYLGTFQMAGGSFVGHLFERK